MTFYYILMGMTLLLIGLAVHKFKAYFLIAGYNTASKKEKEQVNIKGLAKLFGLYGYVNGGVFLGSAALEALGIQVPITPSLLFFIGSTVALVFLSQKYDHSLKDDQGELNQKGKKERFWIILITGFTLLFVGTTMLFSLTTPKVNVTLEGIEVKGVYGELYLWESITRIDLKEEMPKITFKSNGSSLAGHLKGRFNTKEYGNATFFVEEDSPLFIYLMREEQVIILNLGDVEKTRILYEKIENAQQK